MKIELINKEEIKEIFYCWSKFSSVCYNSSISESKPDVIGKHCLKSGHFSGSRSRYFEFIITDVPRFMIDQLVRHEQGVCKNVQSFRYVDKTSFAYEIPYEIKDNNELLDKYIKHMNSTILLYDDIQTYVLDKTVSKERANEQARYVLPMSTHSTVAIGFTIEALIHLMNKRLCIRTEDIFQEMAQEIRRLVLDVLPELKDYLVPQCENLLWCPEGKGCGAYPTKNELKAKLKL